MHFIQHLNANLITRTCKLSELQFSCYTVFLIILMTSQNGHTVHFPYSIPHHPQLLDVEIYCHSVRCLMLKFLAIVSLYTQHIPLFNTAGQERESLRPVLSHKTGPTPPFHSGGREETVCQPCTELIWRL